MTNKKKKNVNNNGKHSNNFQKIQQLKNDLGMYFAIQSGH